MAGFLSAKPVQGMTATDTNIRHKPTGEDERGLDVWMSSACLERVVETCG